MGFGAPSVKGRALRYLAQREHSRTELERKLARHVDDTPEAPASLRIAAALDELTALGFIDEERVAASVLRGQGARFGSRRLKQTLQLKGLDPELISSTLQEARGTELERAREVWRRRYGSTATVDARGAIGVARLASAVGAAEPVSAAERGRQMRFMAGRGFDGDVIRRVMRMQKADAEDD